LTALDSSSTGAFGGLVGAHHMELAAVQVLVKWYPTYLHQVERISGETPGSLELPRSVRISSEQEKMPEDQTPALIVRSPGVMDIPYTASARAYTAQWELEIGCVVSAIGLSDDAGSPRALRLARIHALAIRACIAQQADDAQLLAWRDWIGEAYDTLPSIDDRTICVGRVRFGVQIPNVLTADAGPVDPIIPPDGTEVDPDAPQWPQALSVNVGVVKVPLGEVVHP
jgi:hypothetical protein